MFFVIFSERSARERITSILYHGGISCETIREAMAQILRHMEWADIEWEAVQQPDAKGALGKQTLNIGDSSHNGPIHEGKEGAMKRRGLVKMLGAMIVVIFLPRPVSARDLPPIVSPA